MIEEDRTRTDRKQSDRTDSGALDRPFRLLAITAVSIFIAEVLVMFVMSIPPHLSVGAGAFMDALLLTILVSPVLYFFIVKPLRSHMAERERIVSAIRVSEEKYRSVVESTDDSVYLLDRNSRYLYMNKKHKARMGFLGDEYIGRPYGDFHSGEDARELAREIDEVFETDEPAQREHRSLRDEKYFLRTLSPVKGPDGKILAVNVVSKEITGLKQMEKEREKLIGELQEALAKIKTLKGLIPICAWCKKVRDDKGYWNEIESYVRKHSDADFTHGICPECLKELMDKEQPGERDEGQKS
jgi:PAS domain S-box-containing protein